MSRILSQASSFLVPLVIGLLFAEPLHGQTMRPGSAVRGSTSGPRAGARTSTGFSSGTRSATGQRQYRSNTELGDAMIQIDPETRSLVIVTDEATHTELAKVIANLDKPKPQVLIKVVFLEVTYNKGLDVGIEANYIFNQSSAVPALAAGTASTNVVTAETAPNAAGGTTTTTTTTNNSATNIAREAVAAGATSLLSAGSNFGLASLTGGTFVRLLSDDWSATLRLLATKGKLEVLSRPSIMARNNQEAVIVVGSEVPFITNSRITDEGQTINTIQYDNVGIILRVTPFITSDGTVEMIVAPEISTLTDQTVPISDTVSAPVIAKRSAETVVVTPHGQTIVIGGLMETQKTENVQKVPILGDIPFFGMAFRRTIKADQKRELLIFLTPFIVNDAPGVARETSAELSNAQLVDRAFTKNELSRYLDGLPMPSDKDDPKQPAATPVPKRIKTVPAPVPAKSKPAPVIKTSALKTNAR